MNRHTFITAMGAAMVLGFATPPAGAVAVRVQVGFSAAPTINGGTLNAAAPSPTGAGNNSTGFLDVAGDFSFTAAPHQRRP